MDLGLTPDQIRSGLILYLLLIVCLCLRAYGQAWLAHRLGDPTPEAAGRLTMNPLLHLDLLGSVFLPLLCIFYLQPRMPANAFFFLAWAKPVPINPASFSHPSRHHLYTQMMNPLMSLLAGVVAGVAGGFLYRAMPESSEIFYNLIMLNAALIVLDFLPIPPLPGGMLLREFGLISEEAFWRAARWGGLVLLIALNVPAFRTFFIVLVNVVATPMVLLFQLLLR